MAADELVNRAKMLRNEGRNQEAFAAALLATEAQPENANAWWQFGLSATSIGDKVNALLGYRETVRYAPTFPNGWVEFGRTLWDDGKFEEAEKALRQGSRIDPENESTLRLLWSFYVGQKKEPEQLEVLLKIDGLLKATSDDCNKIGILFYNKRDFGRALAYYRRSAAANLSDTASRFNTGLVYNDPEVSQDVDAVDAWRAVLALKPDFVRATERLENVSKRLSVLAAAATAERESMLSPGESYQFYLNPFELLQADRAKSSHYFDTKTIHRLKKLLLQEIKLEESVTWMDGLVLQEGKVEDVCRELNDEERRSHHWLVFQNNLLLRFLTKGEHRHFLYDSAASPLGLIAKLDDTDSGFGDWLSLYFARQYGLVLTRAIEGRSLAVIEALFDGRRWVRPEHDDICFEAAQRQIARMLEPLAKAAKEANTKIPVVADVEKILAHQNLVQIFNLLPTQFRDTQSEAVSHLRQMAIACHNLHGDSDRSKAILSLCKKFAFKNRDLNDQLAEDFKKIEELIQEQRKYESKLTIGQVASEVTKDGVIQGKQFLPVESIKTMRWGLLVSGTQRSPTYDFLLAFRDENQTEVLFFWKSTQNLEKQEEFFAKMVKAAVVYIAPTVTRKIREFLDQGRSMQIGTCALHREGVVFQTSGFLFKKMQSVPWEKVGTKLENGHLVVLNLDSPNTRTSMPLRTTENAVVLQFLSRAPG